jgi:hypothetical protein
MVLEAMGFQLLPLPPQPLLIWGLVDSNSFEPLFLKIEVLLIFIFQIVFIMYVLFFPSDLYVHFVDTL